MIPAIPASRISAEMSSKIIRWAAVAAICLAGIGASITLANFLINSAPPAEIRIPDFMGLYIGARLVGTPDLYNEQAGWAVQDALLGHHSELLVYLRPPFYATFLKPLLLLDYNRALKAWYALLVFSLIAFVWIFPTPLEVTLCAISWSGAVIVGLLLAQDTILLLVPIALCLRLQGRGKPYLAGLALAVCLIKFHFLLFLPLLIVLQKAGRFAAGLATGSLALIGISFAAQGLRWPADYLHVLLRPSSNTGQNVMVDIRALFLSWPHALAIQIALSLLVAIVVAMISKRAGFDLALCCCLLAALIVNLHVYKQDYVLAIPLLCLLFKRAPRTLPLVFLFSVALYLSISAIVAMAVLLLALVAFEGPELSVAKVSTPAPAPAGI